MEKISFVDKDGVQVVIDVCYPWLPPRCNICNALGHKGESSNSRKIKVLQKDKEIAVATETPDVEINGYGQVRYAITLNLNVVSDLLHELEVIPPALGSNVVGDKSREKFEVGGTTGGDMNTDALKLDWALAGRNPSPPTDRVRVTGAKEFDQVEGDMVISPSRFSVLAIEDNEERDGDADDDIEEAEVVSEVQKVDAKKDTAKNVRFCAGTSLKLSKQLPGRGKETKAVRAQSIKKASSRKL